MRARILAIFLILLLGLSGIGVKVFGIQIRQGDRLSERAARQYLRRLPLVSRRGTIYDRDGRELAVSLRVSSVFAEPAEIQDPAETARALAPVLGHPAKEIQASLTTDKTFVWLQRQLEPRQAEAISDLNLKGIGLAPESRRFYPRQELASHVLGMVGLEDRGLEGVEVLYDDLLGGKPQFVVAQQDALGRLVFRQDEPEPHVPIFDVHLTIDEVLQYIAERELARAVERSGAKSRRHRLLRAGLDLQGDPRRRRVGRGSDPADGPVLWRERLHRSGRRHDPRSREIRLDHGPADLGVLQQRRGDQDWTEAGKEPLLQLYQRVRVWEPHGG
jgi:cell division protein FtsI (penicillin-binding protein 3)